MIPIARDTIKHIPIPKFIFFCHHFGFCFTLAVSIIMITSEATDGDTPRAPFLKDGLEDLCARSLLDCFLPVSDLLDSLSFF